jgi:hypothetical protein
VFQRTVLQEAGRFFKLVESGLPSILARRVAGKDSNSAFGLLCKKLRSMKEEPEDNELSEILQLSLAGTITMEIERIFAIAGSHVDGERKPSGVAAEVRVSFEEVTETKLTLVATKLAEAARTERRYFSSGRWTLYCLVASIIAYALLWPIAFFNHPVAEYATYALVAVLFGSLIVASGFFLRCHKSQDWLRNEATSLSTTEALEDEYDITEEQEGA